MHTSSLAATWKRQESQLRVLHRELSVHICSSRAIHSSPTAESGGVDIRLDQLREQVAIPLRTSAPERFHSGLVAEGSPEPDRKILAISFS
jgi:hypothetical protein